MDLMSLVAKLTLDKSEFDSGLDEAGSSAEGFGSKLKSGLGTAAKAGTVAVTALATATAAGTKALVDGTSEVAAYGDNIDKASQKLGISAEAYQEWDAVMQHSGSSIDGLSKGMMNISSALDELNGQSDVIIDPAAIEKARVAYDNAALSVDKAQIAYDEAVKKNGKNSAQAQKALISLQQAQNKASLAQDNYNKAMQGSAPNLSASTAAILSLGVATTDASGAMRDQEEVFSDVITALQNIEDVNERTTVATQIFGKSAKELGPLLNTSAEETKAMRQRVHELGGVMSNEAVKAAAKYQDSLQDMQTAFDGLKRGMMSEFLPSITTVMDGLAALFSGDEGGIALITDGINQFVTQLAETVPEVLETGTQIMMALINAIVENLPTLLDAATQTIITLAQGLIEQLPMIIEVGLQVLVSLAQGIADNLPTLIPTIVDVVLKIVDILTEPSTLSALVEASIAIIVALADGLIKALPKLVAKGPTIIANIASSLVQNAPKILNAGVQLMASLASGLLNGIGSVISAIGDIGRQIWDGFTSIGKNALDWGKDLVSNFTEGIKAFASKPINAVKSLGSRIKKFLGFSEPEEGPLSDFHTYAPDMVQLFAKGITDNADLVEKAIGDTFRLPAVSAAGVPVGQQITVPRGGNGGGVPRMLTAIFQFNGAEVGRILTPLINTEQQRVGVRLSSV